MSITPYLNYKNPPIYMNWTNKYSVTKVKYQGKCASGWVFAVVAYVESINIIYWNVEWVGLNGRGGVDLSEQQVLYCTSNNGTNSSGCNGGAIGVALSTIIANNITL